MAHRVLFLINVDKHADRSASVPIPAVFMIDDKRTVMVVIIPIAVLVPVIVMMRIPIAIVSPKVIGCTREYKEGRYSCQYAFVNGV
jgi:hypothetical protein